MKTLLFVAASALALTAAACAPTARPDLRTALDCPASQGDLTRTGKAADGKTCTYRSSEGAEVSLQLVPVKGDAAATLQAIEDQIAPAVTRTAADEATKDAADAAKDAAAAAKEAVEDAGHAVSATDGAGDKVDIQIDKHGHRVTADGDTAKVDLPGLHISANDEDANVRIGGIRINANGDEESVHIIRDVRMRGEALSRTKRGIRATFISSGKSDPNGYRFVGYEAAGPKTGPLTVAVVKAKTEIDHNGDIARDVQRLVRRNGGT